MIKLKKVSDLIPLYSIFESVLMADDNFVDILDRMSDGGNTIAGSLLDLINSDITTSVNYLSPGLKGDEISFVNDTQVKRIVDVGADPFLKSRNSAKIGRAVRQILTSNNITINDKQIEEFVNQYRVIWDSMNKVNTIELVSGDAIKYWYSLVNYAPGGGQLNNSCMRYDGRNSTQNCQEFLKIYTENPKTCQLVILKTDDGKKLLGRALLWECSESSVTNGRSSVKVDYYLDRIYTINDYDMDKIKSYVVKLFPDKKILSHTNGDDISKVKVNLEKTIFDKYPYMDSFVFLYPKLGFISNQRNNTDLIFQMRHTNGQKTLFNWVYSERMKDYYMASEVVMVSSINSYMPTSQCTRDYAGNWVFNENIVQSELYGPIDRAQAVQTEWGLVPNRELVDVFTGSRTHIRMPKKLEGTHFKNALDSNGRYRFAKLDQIFTDIFGKPYLLSDRRSLITSRPGMTSLMKVVAVNEESLIPLGTELSSTSSAGIRYQLFTKSGSDIPMAIQYKGSTQSLSEFNIIATELDVSIFGLVKKRATRGSGPTVRSEILIPKKISIIDYYLENPISEKFKKDVKDISVGLGVMESKINGKMLDLDNINTFMYSNYSTYQRNLKNAILRTSTDVDIYREVNKFIANYWRNIDTHVRQYMTNLGNWLSRNSPILTTMLDDFNGRQPFGVEKPLTSSEFKSWLNEHIEMFICQLYLWSITGNRDVSARTASRLYGFTDRRSIAYMINWTYNRYSGNLGDRLFSTCDVFRRQNKPADVILSTKIDAGMSKMTTVLDPRTNVLSEGIKGWQLFKEENLNTIIPQVPNRA